MGQQWHELNGKIDAEILDVLGRNLGLRLTQAELARLVRQGLHLGLMDVQVWHGVKRLVNAGAIEEHDRSKLGTVYRVLSEVPG